MTGIYVPSLFLRAVAVIGALFAFCATAAADPPGRVGRVSLVEGTVSTHAASEQQWSPAMLNDPVTTGDAFWTEPGARAELRVGSAAIHLDGATELDLARLDDEVVEASLPQGTVNLRLRRLHSGEVYAVATPRGSVELLADGTYHLEAGNDQIATRVTVLAGRARLVGPATVDIRPSETAVIGGPPEAPQVAMEPARPTPFDDWALARDRRDERLASPRYVSPDMTGYEDLDPYGRWQDVPEYGAVWYPRAVPIDWAPYRYGHWRWVEPWGWTWVDDAPWGFAPFHYGRWAFIGGRWGWCPGRVVERPVFAPALVVFVGGARWSDRAGPHVGWFPLGPHEVYRPPYAVSQTYVRNVNVTHVTNVNVTNVEVNNTRFANRNFATVVPENSFAASHPVARDAVKVAPQALAGAPLAAAAPVGRVERPHDHASPGPTGEHRAVAHGPAPTSSGALDPHPRGERAPERANAPAAAVGEQRTPPSVAHVPPPAPGDAPEPRGRGERLPERRNAPAAGGAQPAPPPVAHLPPPMPGNAPESRRRGERAPERANAPAPAAAGEQHAPPPTPGTASEPRGRGERAPERPNAPGPSSSSETSARPSVAHLPPAATVEQRPRGEQVPGRTNERAPMPQSERRPADLSPRPQPSPTSLPPAHPVEPHANAAPMRGTVAPERDAARGGEHRAPPAPAPQAAPLIRAPSPASPPPQSATHSAPAHAPPPAKAEQPPPGSGSSTPPRRQDPHAGG
jgi:hypothetical protein